LASALHSLGIAKEQAAMEISDQNLSVLVKSLDVRMANQRVIAANLANVDTPGYQAQKLDFEATMDSVMADPQGPLPRPVINESGAPARTLDGNNVDLDGELAELSRNRMMYSLTSQLISAKFRQMSSVLESQA
jgi:flagellar basal-body rod protein FlgB